MKTRFHALLPFVIAFLTACNLSAQVQTPPRPSLAVDGIVDPALSKDLISLVYIDNLNYLEVTLNNWNPSTVSFKYTDSDLLLPGTRIALYLGNDVLVFEGTVTTFSAQFDDTVLVSTITLVATRKSPPRTPAADLALVYGAGLLEFNPTLTARSNTITCTGIAEGNPSLQMGATLAVSGVGQTFSRTYSVTATKHTFNTKHGYRTEFAGKARATSPP